MPVEAALRSNYAGRRCGDLRPSGRNVAKAFSGAFSSLLPRGDAQQKSKPPIRQWAGSPGDLIVTGLHGLRDRSRRQNTRLFGVQLIE
jgi:hypothetical protein